MQTDMRNKKVLITGGMGFIGSNLARELVARGAQVTIVDAQLPEYGANNFNFDGIQDAVTFVQADVRDAEAMEKAVLDQDYIFDLAAQVSYLDSKHEPLKDLEINCTSKLILLEACRKQNQRVKIVFTSSRMVYGKIEITPVSETHATEPLSLYGIHKLTAEKYFTNYFQNFGIASASVRIPNPYGPRQHVRHSNYGIVGWFIRQAIEGKPIQVFGDGEQIRDYIYIDDLISGLIAVAETEATQGQVYNVGSAESMSFKTMAETVIEAVGQGSVEHVAWPEDYEKNETGDYVADIKKLTEATGWKPSVSFKNGVSKAVAFYKQHAEHYW